MANPNHTVALEIIQELFNRDIADLDHIKKIVNDALSETGDFADEAQ